MPEQPTDLIRPEPFTEDELAKARELRAKLAHILPDDFNNDFFFGRFVRAYRNHEDAIEQKIKELISHRNILGYNASNIVEFCETNPLAKSTFQRFAISHFSMNVFSGDIAVFVQKMEGCDIKEITKVLPLSTVLHSYYFLQTCFLRTIHEHERKTGRPAAVVVILDLQGLNLMDFINPLSVSSKLARLVVKIWSDYFSENLIRLILLHPPAILSLMWQVAKHILDAKTQSRIAFLPKLDDVFLYLQREAVPEAWGGTRRDDSGYSPIPSSCVRAPLPVKEEDLFNAEKFWKQHGFSNVPDSKSISLKSKNIHEVSKECRKGQHLTWLFTVNCDITFEIVRQTDNHPEQHVWPKITLTSLKTPEIGHIECSETGTYKLRFGNTSSSWLSSKLQYSIEVKNV